MYYRNLPGFVVATIAISGALLGRNPPPAAEAEPILELYKKWDYAQTIEGARTEVYKTVGDLSLSLHVFEPESGPKTNRPAIVLFFGGGWSGGSPLQFANQCRYLARRGMVAITADYRVRSRHQVNVDVCVTDAKSAIRWVRANALRLGIDPHRIAAGGGSAGGHLAAATGTVPGFEDAGEDLKISSVPNAMVLFNPGLVLAPIDQLPIPPEAFAARLPEERMGTAPRNLSPAHHVKPGVPPTIIIHGKADDQVPYATAEVFDRLMKEAGNRCDLVGYEGQGHGFFNVKSYDETVADMDRFLVSLGWLRAR